MKRQFILFVGIFLCALVSIYYVHEYILSKISIHLFFSLKNVYIFHGTFSIIVCVSLLFASKIERFKDQLGFLYLGSVVLKIMAFGALFHTDFLGTRSLTSNEGVSLLVPIGLSLFFEVLLLTKTLKKIDLKKKTN